MDTATGVLEEMTDQLASLALIGGAHEDLGIEAPRKGGIKVLDPVRHHRESLLTIATECPKTQCLASHQSLNESVRTKRTFISLY